VCAADCTALRANLTAFLPALIIQSIERTVNRVNPHPEGSLNRSIGLVLLLGASFSVAAGQSVDSKQEALLRTLFPAAASFSPKSGDPPHFRAYSSAAPGPAAVSGYAFWTTELQPFERGYDGPNKILVGMDTAGTITGIIVSDHHEPYGYFSIDRPEFAAQFKGKSIRDPFRVGADIDAVSRASLTVGSSTRAVRDSARRIAQKLLTSAGKR
jgi:transcriptional regulator of nitric oxide reductase